MGKVIIIVVCLCFAAFLTVHFFKKILPGGREGGMYNALKKLAPDNTKTFTLDEIAGVAGIRDYDEALCQMDKLRGDGIVWTSWLHEGKRYGLSGR
jgi:hypothetical protein